eukprot:CAMPEP_0117559172 /NCGR_PEP_ID=MMETSP0784-20121206/53220_1 /TAXON_ID=39447 /ORGANISM="" /LENGTH=254 /DNA_ID=CAMNT_0005356535 /DNA_START=68 /DNA_END=828 /DNA_ORIENTATION=-
MVAACHEVPLLGPVTDAAPAFEVVASTDAFRQLARTRPLSSDRVMEIGCCWGQCTAILAGVASEVLALDVSKDCVDAAVRHVLQEPARPPLASVRIEQLDVLDHPEWLRMLGARTPSLTMVFVDIGGNRAMEDVLRLLQLMANFMPHVRYIALKNEALADALSSAPEEAAARAALVEIVTFWRSLLPEEAEAPHGDHHDVPGPKGSRRPRDMPIRQLRRLPQGRGMQICSLSMPLLRRAWAPRAFMPEARDVLA